MPERVFALHERMDVANWLLQQAQNCRVWAWRGELGAGKTTLIKAVCEVLGVTSPMASPTFSIVNQYETEDHQTVYHFDFYRLKNEAEAYDIGVDEYLDGGSYCFIEWPDRISALLPPRYLDLAIHHQSDSTRKIEFRIHDGKKEDRI
jgi:tRNA threonylcarbamoyladenosine biosynthesis protein TsaE